MLWRKCCPSIDFEAADISADKTLRLDIPFARLTILSNPSGCRSLRGAPRASPHRVIATQSPCHLTLNRAGERPTTISRAICGPEPEGIWVSGRCLESMRSAKVGLPPRQSPPHRFGIRRKLDCILGFNTALLVSLSPCEQNNLGSWLNRPPHTTNA